MTTQLQLAVEAEEMASRLLEFSATIRNASNFSDVSTSNQPDNNSNILRMIERIIKFRRIRLLHVSCTLFSDPAWDVMLELFKSNLSNTNITADHLCELIGPHGELSRRWLNILVDQGLVAIIPSNKNSDAHNVQLTSAAFLKMSKIISEMYIAQEN